MQSAACIFPSRNDCQLLCLSPECLSKADDRGSSSELSKPANNTEKSSKFKPQNCTKLSRLAAKALLAENCNLMGACMPYCKVHGRSSNSNCGLGHYPAAEQVVVHDLGIPLSALWAWHGLCSRVNIEPELIPKFTNPCLRLSSARHPRYQYLHMQFPFQTATGQQHRLQLVQM